MKSSDAKHNTTAGSILLYIIFSVSYFVMFKYNISFIYEKNMAMDFYGFVILAAAAAFINIPFLPLLSVIAGSIGLGIYEHCFFALFSPQLLLILAVKYENKKNSAEKICFYTAVILPLFTLGYAFYILLKGYKPFNISNSFPFLPGIFVIIIALINIYAFVMSFKIKPEKKKNGGKTGKQTEDSYHNMLLFSAAASIMQCIYLWICGSENILWCAAAAWALTYLLCIVLKDRVFYGIFKKAVNKI